MSFGLDSVRPRNYALNLSLHVDLFMLLHALYGFGAGIWRVRLWTAKNGHYPVTASRRARTRPRAYRDSY